MTLGHCSHIILVSISDQEMGHLEVVYVSSSTGPQVVCVSSSTGPQVVYVSLSTGPLKSA